MKQIIWNASEFGVCQNLGANAFNYFVLLDLNVHRPCVHEPCWWATSTGHVHGVLYNDPHTLQFLWIFDQVGSTGFSSERGAHGPHAWFEFEGHVCKQCSGSVLTGHVWYTIHTFFSFYFPLRSRTTLQFFHWKVRRSWAAFGMRSMHFRFHEFFDRTTLQFFFFKGAMLVGH